MQQAWLGVLRPAGGTGRAPVACPGCPRVSPGSGAAPGQPIRSQEVLAGIIHELGTRAGLWGRTQVRDMGQGHREAPLPAGSPPLRVGGSSGPHGPQKVNPRVVPQGICPEMSCTPTWGWG